MLLASGRLFCSPKKSDHDAIVPGQSQSITFGYWASAGRVLISQICKGQLVLIQPLERLKHFCLFLFFVLHNLPANLQIVRTLNLPQISTAMMGHILAIAEVD